MGGKVNVFKLLKEALKEWVRDRAKTLAPALSFYAFLSIGPLVGFIIYLSHKIFGETVTQNEVVPVLKSFFSPQLVTVIKFLLFENRGMTVEKLYSLSLVSSLTLVWASKEYFGQVRRTIESAWHKTTDKPGLKELIKRTLADIKIAVVALLIIIVFVFIRSLLPHPYIPLEEGVDLTLMIKFVQRLLQFALFFILNIFYFTYIPPVKIHLKFVLPGAALGAFMHIIGRGIMESHADHNPSANLAESLVLVLLWFFYSGLVLIYAAEFTKLYVAQKQQIDLKTLHFD